MRNALSSPIRRFIYLLKGYNKDENGYWRDKYGFLIHRIKIYEIFRDHRKDYPLPFSSYIIIHKDENKDNNSIDNLSILTEEEYKYLKRPEGSKVFKELDVLDMYS